MSTEEEGCRITKELMNLIANHLKKVADKLDTEPAADLVNGIMSAKKIFLMGAGRSGFVARAFAMRLMHLGFDVYVIGEATAPAVKSEDFVIAVSGTGTTSSIVKLGEVTKGIGATMASITSEKDSPLAQNSDIILIIPGKNKEDSYEKELAPLGRCLS